MSKVAIVRCEDYDPDLVYLAVKRSVDFIGGMASFVKPGAKVLIKPNILSARKPEEAIDTHPEVVRALIRIVKDAGGSVIVGDAPGGFPKNIDHIYEVSGMRQVCQDEGVELVKFTTSKFVEGVPICRYVYDVDCFISVPKFKTHTVTMITGALKNTYGTVVGLYKAERHSAAPRDREFAKVIAKVHMLAKPHLTVMDAIVAMEGDGPSSGSPRPMHMVVASTDAVAVDSCMAYFIGLKPLDIRVTKEAYALGLGEADLSHIEVYGDDVSTFLMHDFKLPSTKFFNTLPKAVVNSVSTLIRFKPIIDEALCKRCNLCKTSCPVNAINIDQKACAIDYKACVRCMCCHEVCPYKAITVKRNMLTKMVWG